MTPRSDADLTRKDEVESLSARFHAIYQGEAKRQGDVRHHDDYYALPENVREFDRVLARYVLAREQQLREELAAAIERSREAHQAYADEEAEVQQLREALDTVRGNLHLWRIGEMAARQALIAIEKDLDEALAAGRQE